MDVSLVDEERRTTSAGITRKASRLHSADGLACCARGRAGGRARLCTFPFRSAAFVILYVISISILSVNHTHRMLLLLLLFRKRTCFAALRNCVGCLWMFRSMLPGLCLFFLFFFL
jgi:hypothetical protein